MQAWTRRRIGILDIGGAGIGFLAIVSQVPNRRQPADWIICAAFAALYNWGIQLPEDRPNAVHANRTFWLAQVLAFKSPWGSYMFACGFHLTAGAQFAPLEFGANFMLGSQFMFTVFRPEGESFFGLNLFALAVALILVKHLRRHRADAAATDAGAAPAHESGHHGEP